MKKKISAILALINQGWNANIASSFCGSENNIPAPHIMELLALIKNGECHPTVVMINPKGSQKKTYNF